MACVLTPSTTTPCVHAIRGELGLRGSELQGLTRELEFTRRRLANAEKRVEAAAQMARERRAGGGGGGYGGYGDDDVSSWE